MRQLFTLFIAGLTFVLMVSLFFQVWLFALLLAAIAVLAISLFWLQVGQLSVNELEVAVVFNRQQNRFARFLPSGIHWVHPFKEEVRGLISTAGQSVKGSSKGGQTSGGIPVAIDWQVSYSIKPLKISQEKAPKLSRSLTNKSNAIVTKHTNHIAHLVSDRHNVASLIEAGAQAKLEREIRQMARARLDSLGIEVSRIMIDAIHLPQKVRASLTAAHERELRIEAEARGLERLHSVINQFSDEDMARLIEIERIQLLGQNGVTMLYPADGNSGIYNGKLQRVT
ncbi:MAG: SPFH domain-containing protein [Chloroflexota bacterium]